MTLSVMPARDFTDLAPQIDVGRFVYVQRHPFSSLEKTWVPIGTYQDILTAVFDNSAQRAAASISCDGHDVPRSEFITPPPKSAYIEITIRARGGVARSLIRIFVIVAVFVTVSVLTGGNIGLAKVAAGTVGGFLGNLLANALVPPSSGPEAINPPQVYSIEGARNQARPGQAVPIVLGRRRVFADIIVPFYQEVVGEDIYTVGAVCWACHDIELSDLRHGETSLTASSDVQIQHSLKVSDPAPTLVPGIIVPLSQININLEDTSWHQRTTPPNAEQIEIQFYFPGGLGRLTSKGNKKSHTVRLEIRYRPVGTTAWRSTSAATVSEADDVARNIANQDVSRREIQTLFGPVFVDEFHTGLGSGGSVSLTRSYSRSDPGKPFPVSIRFAVPPGVQYEVEVRRSSALMNDDEYIEDVTWVGMNSWVEGNPFPSPELAVTAFRIKAGEDLNGSVDTINAIVQTLCPVYTPPDNSDDDREAALSDWKGLATTSNPADLLLFAMRGPHTTVPTPDIEIMVGDIARFWRSNDLNDYKFDYVETSTRRRGDLQQLIAGAGHARALRIGGRFTAVMDGPQPVGNRTILSPDNGTNFSFSKTFPANVHALRVPFVNRETGYRNDEFFAYAPGYDKNNAEIFEQFSLPGKVEFDDIHAAAQRFLLTSLTQTLSGQCQQDIEGRIVLRFGDRVGIRHSTIEVSGDSGRITAVTTSVNGNVTGFKLSEAPELLADQTYVARWIKIGTDAFGAPYISADENNHLVELNVDFGGESSIHTRDFVFANPVAQHLAPEVGAICVVGILGQDVIDALVTSLDPIDDEGKSVIVKWTEYAPSRFENVVTAPHVPIIPPAFNVRPNAVNITGYQSTDEAINVGFTITAAIGAVIEGFQVDFRETPEEGSEAAWQERPNAPASARAIRLPAGRAGQSFDVRIITLGALGLESDPAILTNLLSFENVVPPENLSVTPISISGPSGAAIPTLAVAVDFVIEALIETLNVEVSVAGTGAWFSGGTASANNPVLTLNGLTPGQSYDVRVGWINIRGASTAIADRPVVLNQTVGNLIADDVQTLAGVAAETVIENIESARQGLETAQEGVEDLTQTFGDTASAAQSAADALAASMQASSLAESVATNTLLSVSTLENIEQIQSEVYDEDFSKGDYWIGGLNIPAASALSNLPVQEVVDGISIETVEGEGYVLRNTGAGGPFITERISRPFVEGQKFLFAIRQRIIQGTGAGGIGQTVRLGSIDENGGFLDSEIAGNYTLEVADGWVTRTLLIEPWALRDAASSSFNTASAWRLAVPFVRGASADIISEISSIRIDDNTQSIQSQDFANASFAHSETAGANAAESGAQAEAAASEAATANTASGQAESFAGIAALVLEDVETVAVAVSNNVVLSANAARDAALDASLIGLTKNGLFTEGLEGWVTGSTTPAYLTEYEGDQNVLIYDGRGDAFTSLDELIPINTAQKYKINWRVRAGLEGQSYFIGFQAHDASGAALDTYRYSAINKPINASEGWVQLTGDVITGIGDGPFTFPEGATQLRLRATLSFTSGAQGPFALSHLWLSDETNIEAALGHANASFESSQQVASSLDEIGAFAAATASNALSANTAARDAALDASLIGLTKNGLFTEGLEGWVTGSTTPAYLTEYEGDQNVLIYDGRGDAFTSLDELIPINTAQKYKINWRVRAGLEGQSYFIGFQAHDASGAALDTYRYSAINKPINASEGWVQLTGDVITGIGDGPFTFPEGATQLRLRATLSFTSGAQGPFALSHLWLSDETNIEAALGHANASFESSQQVASSLDEIGAFAAATASNALSANTDAIAAEIAREDSVVAADNAQGSAAAAETSSILSANASRAGIVRNPTFLDWPITADTPIGWTEFGVQETIRETALARNGGGIDVRQSCLNTDTSCGLVTDNVFTRGGQFGIQRDFTPSRYLVIDAWVKLVSGSWSGAGFAVDYRTGTSEGNNGAFFARRTSALDTENYPTGTWINHTAIIDFGEDDISSVNGVLLNANLNRDLFGAPSTKEIQWGEIILRPASTPEASLVTTQSAVADLEGSAVRFNITGTTENSEFQTGAFSGPDGSIIYQDADLLVSLAQGRVVQVIDTNWIRQFAVTRKSSEGLPGMSCDGHLWGRDSNLFTWVGNEKELPSQCHTGNAATCTALVNGVIRRFLNGSIEGATALSNTNEGTINASFINQATNGNVINVDASATVFGTQEVTNNSDVAPFSFSGSADVRVKLERQIDNGPWVEVSQSPLVSVNVTGSSIPIESVEGGGSIYRHQRSFSAVATISHIQDPSDPSNSTNSNTIFGWRATMTESSLPFAGTQRTLISYLEN